jgi:hypothetical protein
VTRGAALLLLLAASAATAGCGPELPEPESHSAQLYVQYCSGSGCHSAIPPQRSSFAIWQNQYQRMLGIMTDQGWTLPNASEEKEILEYLRKYSRGGGGGGGQEG